MPATLPRCLPFFLGRDMPTGINKRRDIHRSPFAVTVPFTKPEQALIARLAEERQAPKENHASARDKRIMYRDNVATHLIGLMGEYAVSKTLGVPFDQEAYVAGDLEKDMVIFGVGVEIKTLQGYLAFRVLEDFVADVAVLVTYKAGVFDQVTIQGWIDRETFTACHFQDDFGYGVRPCMQPNRLHPIFTLKTFCEVRARHG